jgi:membrane protease YdiL (CAAX protease family)
MCCRGLPRITTRYTDFAWEFNGRSTKSTRRSHGIGSSGRHVDLTCGSRARLRCRFTSEIRSWIGALSVISVRGFAKRIMKFALVPLVAVAALAGAVLLATDVTRAGTLSVPGLLLAFYLPAVVFALAFARKEELLSDWLRPRWGDISVGMIAGIATFGVAWLLVHALAPVGSPRESWTARAYLQLGLPAMLRANSPVVTSAIVLLAVGDNIVFRGWLPALLEPQLGSRRAWIVGAIASAAALLPTAFTLRDPMSGANPLVILVGLAGALLWGGVARVKGSLVPSILAQIVFLWTAVMLFRLWGPGL